MPVRREQSKARSTRPLVDSGRRASVRWSIGVGTTLVLVATATATEGSAVVRPGTTTTNAAHLTAITAAVGNDGVAPTVHEIAVPTVPAAQRSATAASTGSRNALTAPTANVPRARSVPLVAHVESSVAGGFSMLGVTWRRTNDRSAAAPVVAVRTSDSGVWSRWITVHVDPGEGPAAGEDAAVRDGTEPVFVGNADTVEVDVYAASGTAPAELSVSAIDPGSAPTDFAASRSGGSSTSATSAPARDAFPDMPRVVSRRQWGADESLGDPCWAPRYGRTFKAVFVHHTAGSNSYTRLESPGIVRGVYAYHTQSQHWCDIGYNFLVDRYGTVYEGRAGGIRKPVRGAHAGDYNVNSTGISLMGEFTNTTPTRAMRHSLIKLIAWRLGVAYHGGFGHARINGKVFARISGHRDAMSTACPGQRVYDWLPTLRQKVNRRLDGFDSRIKEYFKDHGGPGTRLGVVRVGEAETDGGRHTTFTGGRAYVKGGRLRTIMNGPFQRAYLGLGEVKGRLGYPVSRVRDARKGRWADFEDGAMFLAPKAGRRVLVPGPILRKYRHVGGPNGDLGFPVTDVKWSSHGSYARFRHGVIKHDRTTGRTSVSYG